MSIDPIEVRALALALPETAEKAMYGPPAFYPRGRWFARITREGGVHAVPVGGEELKRELIAAVPGTFFSAPHYDGHAVVLVRLAAGRAADRRLAAAGAEEGGGGLRRSGSGLRATARTA
ncbi:MULTISPECIES: hypothetical protein [unclassified Nonomuraea]|uniref:hypothetical protein n=1 Tax=unclassified Nonomuraea TaxID=2593643 RepID=UPI0033C6347E